MSTLIKEFHFATTTEVWTASPDNDQIAMAWFPPHKTPSGLSTASHGDHQSAPPLQTMGGCVKTTAKKNAAASVNYWEWSGTWEDLGVTAGHTVTAIQADHIWRMHIGNHGGGHSNRSDATWGANTLGSGPFELRDSGGTLIDTFAAIDYAPARSSGGVQVWPAGSGTDLVSFTPPSWRHIVGSNISVPGGSQASNSTIKLRLNNKLPATANAIAAWARLKQDYIKLTITHVAAVNNYFFFAG